MFGTQKMVELHCNTHNKLGKECPCPCSLSKTRVKSLCSVTAIDWSPTGNSFVAACAAGLISSYTRSGSRLSVFCKKIFSISLLRISPDARYVAALTLNSDQVHIIRVMLASMEYCVTWNWRPDE
ncbi:unnamed protein product [Leptidea sinapis]|uniref:Anaphase-promoting complex subunit 4 WD40 domain-containing protein n=1 Tax=Leptidea sinapis TaxID=189913 RepID=A0A5E4QMH8_9NEOP|nr:unnamed protein product [Leptidea sinapis]